jgi:hypothetical protein
MLVQELVDMLVVQKDITLVNEMVSQMDEELAGGNVSASVKTK